MGAGEDLTTNYDSSYDRIAYVNDEKRTQFPDITRSHGHMMMLLMAMGRYLPGIRLEVN